ncbi:MAG: response regulator transcription factor [Pseudomonadota bacterium]
MRILLAEDEAALAKQTQEFLSTEGFTVDHVENGEDALHLGQEERFDLIILDLGLPLIDGVTILKDWRDNGVMTPVLILTARAGWRDRVVGLNAGGDDYIGKPFHMDELLARVRALVRRANGQAQTVLKHGTVEYDTVAGAVTHDGNGVKLTAHELKLMGVMMMQPTRVHSKAELAETLYGYFEERDSNTIEVFVRRLRSKLGANIITTERGLGYRLGPAT